MYIYTLYECIYIYVYMCMHVYMYVYVYMNLSIHDIASLTLLAVVRLCAPLLDTVGCASHSWLLSGVCLTLQLLRCTMQSPILPLSI